jgi:hypothetical protein
MNDADYRNVRVKIIDLAIGHYNLTPSQEGKKEPKRSPLILNLEDILVDKI